MEIKQTAGRNQLGNFAPEFAHYNDDILFGENWNNRDIDIKTRCIVTMVALMASGITDSSLIYHLEKRESARRNQSGSGGNYYSRRLLRRLAQRLGGFSSCQRGVERRIHRRWRKVKTRL